MREFYLRAVLICLLIVMPGLAACASSNPPTTNKEPAVADVAEKAAEAATAAPTAALPTPRPTGPTPTPAPPSPTATRVLRPTATPANTPAAEPAARLYVVKQNDTLSAIATNFDTSVEALAEANELEANDFLQIGQELVIPITELGEPAAPTGESVSAGDDATSAAPANANPAEGATSGEADLANETITDGQVSGASPADQANPAPAPENSALPATFLPDNINPLTGLAVDDPAVLRRRPLMVRIGNDVGARQGQIGLNSADMVYEEIAEWWVTRFTAIFLSAAPDTVGPVRSSRLVNVQLAPQYQGALAHSGGSDPVRWEISQAHIANLDEYYNPGPYFYRPNQGWQTRLAINTQAARDYMSSKNLEAPVRLPGFLFSDTIAEGEPGEHIYIPYPQATSFTEWHYDRATGKYLRWIKGSPLVDVASGQVTASNVVIYFAEHRATDIVEDSNGATSIRIIVNGSGPAWFFRDGKLNKGFWQTDGARPPYFTYAGGQPYPLKPGNTWVELVPTYYQIGVNSPDEASSKP